MNSSTVSPTTLRPLTQEEFICGQIAAAVYDNVIKYLGMALAVPIHILIVFLLFLKVSKRRFYHYLIMAQSITDVVALLCLFATHSLCVVFKKLLRNFVYPMAPPIQLVLTIYLVVYWKTAIRPQRLLDGCFYIAAAVSTLEAVAEKIFRQINWGPTQYALLFIGMDIVANLTLTVVCFTTFILVMRMDVSHFSEVTVKGQKKMTTALLLQFIFVLITNIFDIMDSGSNYLSISEPTVVKLNQMLETETDPVILARYRKELMEHLGPIIAFVNTLVLVTVVYQTFLPFARGVLICWAIKPILQRKTVIMISRSTTDS